MEVFKNLRGKEGERGVLIGMLISRNYVNNEEGILLLKNPKTSKTLLSSSKYPKDEKEKHDRLVGSLLSKGKINPYEAVLLLGFKTDGMIEWGEKTLEAPDQDTARGLLFDTPHHSPQPIIPIMHNTDGKKRKGCKCNECKCGTNKDGIVYSD